MPLLAPTGSTIVLTATNSILPINGTTDIVATVLEKSGTPVQNGTLVTFSTTLGSVDPAEARTNNGTVQVRLHAGTRSGTAVVRAFSGGATTPGEGAGSLSLTVGGAGAERVVLTASGTVVPLTGGTIVLTANVTDAATNALVGAPVVFTTTAGTLSNATALTDDSGNARAILTTNVPATVTAAVGGKTSNQVAITTVGQPTISITPPTTTIFEDQPAVFTVAVTAATGTAIQSVTVSWGDGTTSNLGNPSGSTTITHVYGSDGLYNVSATVRDTNGQTAQVITTVVVIARAPLSLTLTANETNPQVGAVVRFTVAATQAGQAVPIVRSDWHFGDAAVRTVNGPDTTHVYDTIGRKLIRVVAYTAENYSAETTIEVNVRAATTTPPPTPLPPGGTTTWPTTGAALVAWAEANYAAYLVAGVTAAQRESYMAFVRDRMIEAGRCGGMDLAWNLKRGGPDISTDYVVHRSGGADYGVDIAASYDDTSSRVRLQWSITAVGTAQLVFYGGYTGTLPCR